MKGKKASRTQTLLRVTEIVRIRLDGAKEWDVSEYVREQETTDGSPWQLEEGETPLCDRQIRRYVRRAEDIIQKSTDRDRERILARHLARRENLYAKAVNAGDIRTALSVLQDDAKLRGLYPPTQTQVTGKDGTPLIPPTPERLTHAQRETAVAAILARLGATSN